MPKHAVRAFLFCILFGLAISLSADAQTLVYPRTGVTLCYNATQEINCPAQGKHFYGQDAHHLNSSAPINYTSMGDGSGSVRDEVTGLIWQKDNLGAPGDWNKAEQYCKDLELNSYSDWRMPTIEELLSIIHYGKETGPAIHEIFYGNITAGQFNPAASFFYSNTPFRETTSKAWRVLFGHGSTFGNSKAGQFYVRCVRTEANETWQPNASYYNNNDGTVTHIQTGLIWQRLNADMHPKNWQEALAYCHNLTLGGIKGWRLPNIRELAYLADRNLSTSPALDPALFEEDYSLPPCSMFWSSTTQPAMPYDAWYMNADTGSLLHSNKDSEYYAICANSELTLAASLSNTLYNWATGDDAAWFARLSPDYPGGRAAQSGSVSNDQISWLQTTVSGPGILRFDWNANCEPNDACLCFYLADKNPVAEKCTTGINWTTQEFQVPKGEHTLKWEYRGGGDTNGTGWVSMVIWTPTPSYHINATAAEHGQVSGGGEYYKGDTVSLRALSDRGFAFSHWVEGDQIITGAGAYYNFLATASRTLVAHFKVSDARQPLPGVLLLLLEDE